MYPRSRSADRGRQVRLGSQATVWRCADHFRSTPINGHRQIGLPGPVRAMKRHPRESGGGVVSSQISIASRTRRMLGQNEADWAGGR
jgi:hypothetical protein